MHVAVAHHGEDQLETMLIALCRARGSMAWLACRGRDRCGAASRWCGRCWGFEIGLRGSPRARPAFRQRDDPTNTDPQGVRAAPAPRCFRIYTNCGRMRHGESLRLREFCERRSIPWMTSSKRRSARLNSANGIETSSSALPAAVIAAGLRRAALDTAPLAGDELNQRHLLLAAECIRSADRKPRQFDWPRRLRLAVTSKNSAGNAVDFSRGLATRIGSVKRATKSKKSKISSSSKAKATSSRRIVLVGHCGPDMHMLAAAMRAWRRNPLWQSPMMPRNSSRT